MDRKSEKKGLNRSSSNRTKQRCRRRKSSDADEWLTMSEVFELTLAAATTGDVPEDEGSLEKVMLHFMREHKLRVWSSLSDANLQRRSTTASSCPPSHQQTSHQRTDRACPLA